MNNLDKTYTSLLQDILDNGVEKKDRTGTGTISVFGRQIRHKMSEGFPLLTTKKMYMKGVITELLWFLRGDTNIQYLVQNNCHIWDGDAYKSYLKNRDSFSNRDNVKEDVVINGMNGSSNRAYTMEEFINTIRTNNVFAERWGELGPVYGKQWRSWGGKLVTKRIKEESKIPYDQNILEGQIDQISNLINNLKTNPDSRRLMVNAWNVGEIDEMVLPPCHYGFQVYTRELSRQERSEYYYKYGNSEGIVEGSLDRPIWKDDETAHKWYNEKNIPTRAISLMWNQRSCDLFLGIPFNIASYGLLLEILAKEVNMVPDELIGNLGDVHLYSNHIEQAKEQIGRERTHEEMVEMYYAIENKKDRENKWTWQTRFEDNNISKHTREPYPLPTLKINSGNENWHLLDIDDIVYSLDNELTFKLENYQSHPSIKAPLSN
jgi:thymidylate synthase